MLTLAKLKKILDIISLKEVCKQADINYQTMISRLRNDTELTVVESQKLTRVLKRIPDALNEET